MADDVQVANRRLDASQNQALMAMARMGADAFGLHGGPADRPWPRRAAAPARLAAQQLHLLPRPHDALAEHFGPEEILEIVTWPRARCPGALVG